MLELLDQHIAGIKNEIAKKKSSISEHEKLKMLYQDRLQHLHKEIEELKTSAIQKFDFLKMKLDTELEVQHAYRQKVFSKLFTECNDNNEKLCRQDVQVKF